MINAWKKQAVEGMATVFCGKAQAADAGRKSEIDPLHAKIANWWWNGFFASDLRSPNVGARCDDQTGSPQLPITRARARHPRPFSSSSPDNSSSSSTR